MNNGKIKTVELRGGIKYAKVADRLREFWEMNPAGKIETVHEYTDGGLISRAYIWKDKAELVKLLADKVSRVDAYTSADSNGTAYMDGDRVKQLKGHEKNETIAVGRALALLGYGTDGEIASSEEMEEFNLYRAEKQAEKVAVAIKKLKGAKTTSELKKVWLSLDKDMQLIKEVREAKDSEKERCGNEGR